MQSRSAVAGNRRRERARCQPIIVRMRFWLSTTAPEYGNQARRPCHNMLFRFYASSFWFAAISLTTILSFVLLWMEWYSQPCCCRHWKSRKHIQYRTWSEIEYDVTPHEYVTFNDSDWLYYVWIWNLSQFMRKIHISVDPAYVPPPERFRRHRSCSLYQLLGVYSLKAWPFSAS